ncbi:MAG: (Fe-S)-binding protein [Flavobacteriales bacterium]|nr:(Fe-S)-binding protein [Flavobacteriales bacterium]
MIEQILFILLLGVAVFLTWKRFRYIRRNIFLGRKFEASGSSRERWATMARVALGQSKMMVLWVPALMHFFIYVGFIIINIEVLEIVIDGIFGTHRIFSILGGFYDFLIGSFEILALLVLIACVVFLARRNIIRLRRFHMKEMTSWPKSDANIILFVEVTLMTAFLSMNACDLLLQNAGAAHYVQAGSFPVSSLMTPIFEGLSQENLVFTERILWWYHIIGILAFLVYVTYSKHLHIILAFPNTYYSKLVPAGQLANVPSVTREVKLMLDPSADPYAAPVAEGPPEKFGARDVTDLTWKQLLDAYTCTECGRCSSVCPANLTGKLLSPRKIMMDTRDRLEEVGNAIDNGETYEGKSLLRDYITEEELWACTSCNACTEACPVNIDPLGIIIDLRRYLIMEESKSPESITTVFNNIENNGAPWAFSPADRNNWTK